MKALRQNLEQQLGRLSPAATFALACVYLLGLGVLDFHTPAGMSFSIFYLFGITFSAWKGGPWPAVILSAVATFEILFIEATWLKVPSILWWNAITRFVLFAAAGWLASETASLSRQQGQLVNERTAEWEAETERHKSTAAELREADAQLRRTLESARMVGWDYDVVSERIHYSNNLPGFVGGVDVEPYCSRAGVLLQIHPDERNEVDKALTQACRDPAYKFEQEYRALMLDGTYRWTLGKGQLVPGPNGASGHVLGVSMDITERKRAEQLLLAQRDLGLQLALTSDLQTALNVLVDTAVHLDGLDCGGVYLRDPVTGDLHLAVHKGLSGAFVRAVSHLPGTGKHAMLVNQQKPVFAFYGQLSLQQEEAHHKEALRAVAIVPLCHEGNLLGCVNLASHTRDRLPSQTQVALEAIAAQTAGVIARIQAETERHILKSQILEISDREQARIGQEIHDGLCQQLVALAFDAAGLETRLAAEGHPQAPKAKRIAHYLDEAITEARQLSRGLFPIRLETEGLASALEELARSTQERFHVRCSFSSSPSPVRANHAVATHLYRIAQEAITNALKHANPSRIIIALSADAEGLELRVSDDGTGFSGAGSSEGMGLHIMEYRARSVGASLSFRAAEPSGTHVCCRVPATELTTKLSTASEQAGAQL